MILQTDLYQQYFILSLPDDLDLGTKEKDLPHET